MRKQYIDVPRPMECSLVRKLWQRLIGVLLSPYYVIAALCLGTPGVALHVRCARLGVRLFILGRISLSTFYSLVCCPMDSIRYFEFHEALSSLAHVPFSTYLDVSSPNILPLMLLMKNRTAVADLVNPDNRDLVYTEQLALAFGVARRCIFTNSTIEMAKCAGRTFDLITCISVLEHIPADREALDVMWSLLRPGGRLILTLPCMAQPLEQYISFNHYGVLAPGLDGYTFWQRYYDEERLHTVVFDIAGLPTKMVIYGERSYGLFYRNASMKRLLGSLYPNWREPYMMAKEYRYFQTVAELPGEGVVMLEFMKQ
jgi:SAM-dependent methyltransferase